MTVCNMSHRGRRARRPDRARRHHLRVPRTAAATRPQGAAWDAAVARWRQLPTDDGAAYDQDIAIDADALEPMITFGTNPGMGIPITGARARSGRRSADPGERDSSRRRWTTWARSRASRCSASPSTWSSSEAAPTRRMSDLRAAAAVLKGRKVNPQRARDGGAGLAGGQARRPKPRACDEIFRDAGAEWREAGLLDVHRHERRPAAARPVQRFAPATATSKAARARAGARSWPAR